METRGMDETEGSNVQSNLEGGRSKFKSRKCSISILLAVFLQTFVVAVVVLCIPLFISFNAMTAANNLSTATGRDVARNLAHKIQNVEGSLALQSLEFLIQLITQKTMDIATQIHGYSNQSNPDSLFETFALVYKYSGYDLNMYYGDKNNVFTLLQAEGPNSIWMTIPYGYKDPSCKLCTVPFQNITPSQDAQSKKWGSITADGVWNQTLWKYDGFYYGAYRFLCTTRPWYKQAASLNPKTAKVQFTSPYIYAGGGVGETGGATAGITANYPFFDGQGEVIGVYGSDVGFTDMHKNLQSYLQTANSFIYVMTPSGVLIGTSNNESIIDTNGNLKNATSAVTPSIRTTATLLQSFLSPGQDFTSLSGYAWEQNGLYFQLEAIQDAPFYVVVNGAPKSDYTGNLDAVLTELQDTLASDTLQILEISTGVFVGMVLISCIVTYFWISVPLKKITTIMSDAAKFEFKAYQAMERRYGSFINELSTMEKVFYDMIAKFAQAIRSNQNFRHMVTSGNSITSTHRLDQDTKKGIIRS